ncbi:MAG: polymer-forming cytoskeletal protein [Desulfovermiculus sp.]|nr:polymer-forming cytoskeletal protein [Desulfovermiculus sp.]
MKDEQNHKRCRNLMSRSQGSVLIALVVAMIVIGLLGAAVVSLQGTSSIHEVRANHAERAYNLAESGFRYAHSVWKETQSMASVQGLNGTYINAPAGGGFLISDVQHNTGSAYVFGISQDQTLTEEETLIASNVNASNLPKYNGIFSIQGGVNDGCRYRYLKFDNSSNALEKILKLPDGNGCSYTFQAGTNATNLEYIVLKSRGVFPGSGDLNVNRTVTYWWPVSGEENGTSDIPSFDAPIALQTPNGLSIANQNFVQGDISGNDVTLENQSEVTGNVVGTGDVVLENQSEVGKGICANGDVELQNQTSVAEDINAHGDVELGANKATVKGDVYADGDVTLKRLARVEGDIHSGGSVYLENDAEMVGNIYAANDVQMTSSKVWVGGNINAGNNVIFAWMCTVDGNVIAGGDISDTSGKSTIEGDAIAGGSIDLDVKVKGEKRDYDPNPNPEPPEAPQICTIGSMPDHSSFSTGGENITVSHNEDKDDIEPGEYDELSLGGQNEIRMEPGTYTFSEINSDWILDLYLDLSNEGSFYNIFVQNDVNLLGQLHIYVKGDEGYEPIMQGNQPNENVKNLASRVYLETLGSFTMSTQSEWFGTIYAQDDISFGDSNVLIGSYHTSSGTINTANQLEVYHVPYMSNGTSSEVSEFIPPIQN